MSILSRLLKREGEGDNGAAAPAASVQVEEPAPAGPLPAEEYPESAESTDQSLAVRTDESGVVLVDVPLAPTPPPLPPQSLLARPAPAPAAVSPEAALAAQAAPLRDLMLEVRWGTAQPRWLPLVRPVVQGLRDKIAADAPPAAPAPAAEGAAEAAPAEPSAPSAPDVPALLDALAAALDLAAAGPGGASALAGEARKAVLAAYEPLVRARPGIFGDGDGDAYGDGDAGEGNAGRRERLIVESLLGQVTGLEPLLVGKLTAVGLGRLENLVAATAEEVAGVAGVPEPIAAALVDKVAEFRRSSPPALAGEPRGVRRQLEPLLTRLETLHTSFERAASGWSEHDVAAKRRNRREREQAFMAMRAALARQGAVEFLLEIEKLPFGRRIEALGRFLKDPRTALGSSGNVAFGEGELRSPEPERGRSGTH